MCNMRASCQIRFALAAVLWQKLRNTNICGAQGQIRVSKSTLALSPLEFMRRFLQHVLPSGFMKVRYFGFLSSSCSMPIEEVKGRIELAQGFAARAPQDAPAEVSTGSTAMCCPHCGGRLLWRSVVLTRPLGSRSLSRAHPAANRPPGATAVGESG
jgi:hypothetical protein